MYINLVKVMPNGSPAVKHEIRSITIQDSRIIVSLLSFTENSVVCWSQDILVPASALSSEPQHSVAHYLIQPNQYLDGGVVFEDPTAIEVLRETLKSAVDLYKEHQISKGCQTPYGVVDSDDISIRNIMGTTLATIIAALDNQNVSVNFRMKDNREVLIDRTGVITIAISTFAYVNECYQRSFSIKNLIDKSDQTIETLQQIDIPALWDTILNTSTPSDPPQ